MAVCKSCGAQIVWMLTVRGKRIPIQADENGEPREFEDTGKPGRLQRDHIEMNLLDGVETTVARALGDEEAADPELPIWLSHFVSCPHADQHRKG